MKSSTECLKDLAECLKSSVACLCYNLQHAGFEFYPGLAYINTHVNKSLLFYYVPV